MATTSEYLEKLVNQKNELADNLNSKGVESSYDETLETLVPKVLEISGGGGGGIYPVDENGLPTGDVVIPEGVTAISTQTINTNTSPFQCSTVLVTSISCPSTLTSIGYYAFYGLQLMTSISGIENVTYIGQYAFSSCRSLTSVVIPNASSFGTSVFRGCTALANVTFAGGWNKTVLPRETFCDCKALKNIEIPACTTEIGYAAFNGAGLESVVVPSGVTRIDGYGFSDCASLVEITLPNTLTSVNASNGNNSNSFNRCTALTTVNLEQDFDCTISFFNCTAITNAAEMLTKLKDLTGQTAKTITFAKTVYDGLTAEQIAVGTNKNWTVASYW